MKFVTLDFHKKEKIDSFGAVALIAFSALLGINHVVIKIVNTGIQPVFFCGLRSALAAICILGWMKYKNIPIKFPANEWKVGILAGIIFAFEFLCLFIALDYTTVVRNSIIYYSMPLWLSIMAHFLLPNEKISLSKSFGLILAFMGVVWAMLSKEVGSSNNGASIIGDIFALGGAIGWAAIILMARGTYFSKIVPEMQLLWMVLVSTPILLLSAPFFGEILRDFELIHMWGLLFQSIVVVTIGFIFWLWLLSIYPASGVASFAFLTPIFGMSFGWLFLNEPLSSNIILAGAMVTIGIYIINKTE